MVPPCPEAINCDGVRHPREKNEATRALGLHRCKPVSCHLPFLNGEAGTGVV